MFSIVYQNRQGSGDFENNTCLEAEQLDNYPRSYNNEGKFNTVVINEYFSIQ